MIRQTAIAIVLLSVSAGVSAQTSVPDPWKRVPPLPTTCYSDAAFKQRVNSTLEQIGNDYMKQREINIDVNTRFGKMDMQERMQRTQAFMMKNPQAAMKMMQSQQEAATGMSAGVVGADEARKRLNEEFERDHKAWEADFDKAAAALRARREELRGTKTRLNGPIYVWTSAEAEAEYNSLIQKENAEYEKRCASYYGANGKVPTWLATYRREVIDRTAAAEEGADNQVLMQMSMVDFPSGGFSTTAPYTAVREYLDRVLHVYGLRHWKLTTEINAK